MLFTNSPEIPEFSKFNLLWGDLRKNMFTLDAKKFVERSMKLFSPIEANSTFKKHYKHNNVHPNRLLSVNQILQVPQPYPKDMLKTTKNV